MARRHSCEGKVVRIWPCLDRTEGGVHGGEIYPVGTALCKLDDFLAFS